MVASEFFLHRLLDGADKKFVVPVYQRPYEWDRANCEQLYKDLKMTYLKGYQTHFFGSITYVANNIAGVTEHLIIDGQQRITSVSLLLLAIKNYVEKGSHELKKLINTNKIMKAYLIDEYANEDNKLKLKLVREDEGIYKKLIDGEPVSDNSFVSANYKYFCNEIQKLTDEEVKGIYDSIMKLQIVNITLSPDKGDDPQLIFESLNSTGLRLSEGDKIRNFVLMNLSASQQEKYYRKYWEKMEANVGHVDLDRFIRYYLALKTKELPSGKQLYFVFKDFLNKSIDDVETVLRDMLAYSIYYKQIKTASPKGNEYEQVLCRLNKLEVNSAIPLVMNILNAIEIEGLSDADVKRCLETLENYVVRRIVCGLGTNGLNKLFVALNQEIEKYVKNNEAGYVDSLIFAFLGKTGRSRFPNDHEFEEKFPQFELYNAKSAVRKYLFERIENYGTKERIAVEEQIEDGTLTIEHIMPQKLTPEWKKHLGLNWELIHTKYLDTIGNLTLTAYNSSYSNLSFEGKKTLPDKGFVYSKLTLNAYIKECDEWTEEQITERAKKLYEISRNIWWMPSTDFSSDDEEEWVSWDDDYDFTNKTIVEYRLFDEPVKTSNISDAYKKINEAMYSLDPGEYGKFTNINCSSDPSKLRAAYQLGDNMYINTNLSSQAKMDVVYALMTHFGCKTNDLVFCVRDKIVFDIKNENTYGVLTAGKLAYELIKELLLSKRLTEKEIGLLKTKEYTRKKFAKVTYPVLADHRTDNMGGGIKKRYRKDPVNVDGKDYYISSEWFDESRDDLINWYKEH